MLHRIEVFCFLAVPLISLAALSTCVAAEPSYSILTGDAAKALVDFYRGDKPSPDEYWSPTPQDVEKAEAALPRLFVSLSGSVKGGPEDYFRQYCGIKAKGRKIIYVSFIRASVAKNLSKDGLQKPMLMYDGGANFWRMDFDPATESFSNWQPNGTY